MIARHFLRSIANEFDVVAFTTGSGNEFSYTAASVPRMLASESKRRSVTKRPLSSVDGSDGSSNPTLSSLRTIEVPTGKTPVLPPEWALWQRQLLELERHA